VLGLTNIKVVDPYYLMIFLRCKYGFEQLYRQRELTIQFQLTLPRVKDIDVFLPSDNFQRAIRSAGINYILLHNESKRIYQSAEQLLLSTVSRSDFTQSQPDVSVKLFSESFAASGRLDAEYYQPKYDELFASLSKQETQPLGGKNGIATIKKSIEPGSEAYCDEGIPFIRVSDITKFGITDPEIKLSRDVVPNITVLFPRRDTILFSKDGSVGIAYKVECNLNAVTSGALLHLTVKDPGKILPDYLTLVLNSKVVQMQAERDSNGAIIQHWKPSEIEKVVIPVLDIGIQKQIAAKVQESFSLRHQSERLLENAKCAVEIAIELGEDRALRWLKEKGVEG
jgi:type I restriction enzyme S subunit